MPIPNTSAPLESRSRYWRRVLRPLTWWLLLVLVLFGIRTHERLMEQTRLNFNITLAGQTPYPEAKSTFDGKPIVSGENISLGNHEFAVTHPKGDAFTTNFFVWYGPHDLQTIDLKRTMSMLSVTADPPAPVLSIHGPEWDVELTNTPGMTSSVPTDEYVVRSRYAHWSRSDNVPVSGGVPAAWRITPRLGAAQITCNEADATGQFLQADGQVIEYTKFPYSISELPEGTYQVTAQHNNDVLSRTVSITAETTNNLAIKFLYGSAVLETAPTGVTVRTSDGRFWGVTPLNLPELQPGSWTFSLQHEGYESINVPLTITVNHATTIQTNLVSVNYTASMKMAQQDIDVEDYDNALLAANNALIAKPGDADALGLQRTATGFGALKRAKQLGLQGDFMGGERELGTTLGIFPDNAEAQALFAEYKRREPEQIERLRVDRLNRGNVVFKNALLAYADADLFESHEFKTTRPVNEVHAAILDALRIPPEFNVTKDNLPAPETYEIEFVQEFKTFLNTRAGRRVCVIVCAQTKDDETQILCKILEYKTEAQIKFSIGNLIGTPDAVNYVPISASRLGTLSDKLQARLNEGVTNLTARIQGAIGQISVVQPVAPMVGPQ